MSVMIFAVSTSNIVHVTITVGLTPSAATMLFPLGSGRQHVSLLQPHLGLKWLDQGLSLGVSGCLCAHEHAATDFVARATQVLFAAHIIRLERIWVRSLDLPRTIQAPVVRSERRNPVARGAITQIRSRGAPKHKFY